MAAQYLTLKKSDSEFLDYLWGRSPKLKQNQQRAIPVKTYNLGTPEESVTFELQKVSEFAKPGSLLFLTALIKLNSFSIILFPLLYLLVKNYTANSIQDPLSVTLAALSTILLFSGMNIRNDVFDHVSGFDRVNLDSNKKPIRLGWISASAASKISLFLICISAVVATPVVLLHLNLIKLVAAAMFLFFIGRFAQNNSYKHQRTGEMILFILVGPLLAAGYQLSMGAELDNEVMSFGFFWGVLVSYLVQVNNFSHIMTSSLSGIKNTMTRLGFDRSQKFLIWSWSAILLLWLLFQIVFVNIYWAVVGFTFLVAVSAPLYKKIRFIKSPMGSGLQQIRRLALKSYLMMLTVFLCEIIWKLWVIQP